MNKRIRKKREKQRIARVMRNPKAQQAICDVARDFYQEHFADTPGVVEFVKVTALGAFDISIGSCTYVPHAD